jgi:hypothetical protein
MDKRVENKLVRKTVFEFGAWLTSREGTLKVGCSHDCSLLVLAIDEWLKLIGVIKPLRITRKKK